MSRYIPPPSLNLYGLAVGFALRMRVSVNAMTVSPRARGRRYPARYRHRYRQILWLQETFREWQQTWAIRISLLFQASTEVDECLRTTANGDVAGGLGFEPRKTESESAVIPFHHPPTMPLKSRQNWSRGSQTLESARQIAPAAAPI